MPYPQFDRRQLQLAPLQERVHDMSIDDILSLTASAGSPANGMAALEQTAERIGQARQCSRPVIAAMGAHVIKAGLSRFIIDLLRRGYLTHIALNGAGAIHDFELALIGGTTESVARYIQEGQFGLWEETGWINDLAGQAAREQIGLGEVLGREISTNERFRFPEISILSAAYRAGVPVTVHAAIGQDIIHEHPNCDGGLLGQASYNDFLVFTQALVDLEGGVFLNIGTAVMGPEVYLKALAMVRNAARQKGSEIRHFTTAVFDLAPLSRVDYHQEPPKSAPEYYLRYWKTILVRTVQDGGESFYIEGDHRNTIPRLHRSLAAWSDD